jgi:hypothetical protein
MFNNVLISLDPSTHTNKLKTKTEDESVLHSDEISDMTIPEFWTF